MDEEGHGEEGINKDGLIMTEGELSTGLGKTYIIVIVCEKLDNTTNEAVYLLGYSVHGSN